VDHLTAALGVSERFACRVLGQHRSTQRKAPVEPDDEAALRAEMITVAKLYGRYGYRRITALLRAAGWAVNHKCAFRGKAAGDSDRSQPVIPTQSSH
jgi:hypothetical protein